jgi:O-antigen/teichoic acid export membrane protein
VSERDVAAAEGLGSRAARGAAVTLGAQGIKILVQLASVIVLARLLSPTDYGLVTMVVAIIGVGEIFRDFGLSSAAIQAPTLSRGQRDNLQWINTGIGLVLAGTVFASAGLIAQLYGHEQLVPLAQVLSVTFLVNGFATQYRADLIRRMRFRALALADVAAPVVALGVAIVGALLGWGYWALAGSTPASTTRARGGSPASPAAANRCADSSPSAGTSWDRSSSGTSATTSTPSSSDAGSGLSHSASTTGHSSCS